MADTAPSPPPHLDPNAWDALIESLNPPTILVAISSWMGERIRQHLAADDIWQETLAMAWRDRDKHEWHGARAYRAWLLQIAKNRIRETADHIAAQKRGGDRAARPFSTMMDSQAGSISALLPPGSTTPSRVATHREEAELMARALDGLPTELREVVRLRIFEELPMKAVAERAGVGLTSAKERFFRGAAHYRTRLQELLGGSTRVRRPEP